MFVVVNPAAGAGHARARWQRVLARLRVRTRDEFFTGDPARVKDAVRAAVQRGETEFVAAGGDGTVNLVATALVEAGPAARGPLTLGAIGLGSSNDFHKPHPAEAELAGIPTRLDFGHAEGRDICAVAVITPDGAARTLYWIVNASVGITAEANWFFNHPDGWLARLKRLSSDVAIVWAALRTILTARALPARLTVDDGPAEPVRLRNLGVVKNPHFAGGLHYDSPFEPASGEVLVHLVGDVGLLRLLRTFAALGRGRFAGLPGTRSWRARRVILESERPFAVEGDGEVIRAVRAEFQVLPQRLRICTP
jgi:diacylglycerol kinase family enzyme